MTKVNVKKKIPKPLYKYVRPRRSAWDRKRWRLLVWDRDACWVGLEGDFPRSDECPPGTRFPAAVCRNVSDCCHKCHTKYGDHLAGGRVMIK